MPALDPASARIVVERANKSRASRDLWRGLVRFNRLEAGKLRYERTVRAEEVGDHAVGR